MAASRPCPAIRECDWTEGVVRGVSGLVQLGDDSGDAVKSLIVPPDPALLESMRSIGYTVESAVADVIDNSVAASASVVEVLFSSSGPFEIAIIDDGTGMTRDEAVNAMRLAATSPTSERSPNDLGRFGLGLKTASLSQCRTLTLVTKKHGVVSALRWSLDHVIATAEWSLVELQEEELERLLGWDQLAGVEAGTLVHWGDLDQLEMTEGSEQSDLDRIAVSVKEHISLVFHLFIAGDGVRETEFRMNGGVIQPTDPFMSTSTKIQKTEWEPIDVEGETVRLRAFTLPYLNRLSAKERAAVLRLGSLRETQGFYVYRGARLVIWGTWFRVMPKSEMAKLTRVRVDIPNSLDHLWALDVKKATADPPPQVRRRLRELAKTMMLPSEKVQKFRGRKVGQLSSIDFMWDVRVSGDEFRYEINTRHPSIESFVSELSDQQRKQFELVLDDIQTTFPIIDAHNRMSGDGIVVPADQDVEVFDRAVRAWALVRDHAIDLDSFVYGLAGAEPYCLIPDFEKTLRARINEGR